MAKFTKKKKIASVATVLVMASGGAAFAYWSAGGTGTGTATTAAGTTPVTAVQTSMVTAMAPGVTAQTLSGNFTNNNTGPVYVTTVTASIASVTPAAGAAAGTCDATDYILATPTMTVNKEVAVGSAQGTWTGATLTFNNKTTNQDACKGATVNLAYAVV